MFNRKNKRTFAAGLLKYLAVMVLTLMVIIPSAVPVSAESSVDITGGDAVTGGETFTVTVTYSGDEIGRVVAGMNYDPTMLTYISGGSSSGNTGYIALKNAGTGEALSFQLKFQALKEGETTISVTTREMYDLAEQYMDNPSGSKVITISGDASEDELVEPSMAPEEDVTPDTIGVDEKEDETNYTMILAIGAAVAAILIIIIAIVIRRKK